MFQKGDFEDFALRSPTHINNNAAAGIDQHYAPVPPLPPQKYRRCETALTPHSSKLISGRERENKRLILRNTRASLILNLIISITIEDKNLKVYSYPCYP
jgi:hypothetical protein